MASERAQRGHGWRIDGDRLHVGDGAEIPPVVCLRTGVTSDVASVRTLVRHESSSDALASVVALGVGLLYGRSDVARIRHGLARGPRLRRTVGLATIVGATLALPAAAVAAAVSGEGMLMAVGMLVFITLAVIGDAVRGTELRATRRLPSGDLELACHPHAIETLLALQREVGRRLDDEADDDE